VGCFCQGLRRVRGLHDRFADGCKALLRPADRLRRKGKWAEVAQIERNAMYPSLHAQPRSGAPARQPEPVRAQQASALAAPHAQPRRAGSALRYPHSAIPPGDEWRSRAGERAQPAPSLPPQTAGQTSTPANAPTPATKESLCHGSRGSGRDGAWNSLFSHCIRRAPA
jgi:hypothetical protein